MRRPIAPAGETTLHKGQRVTMLVETKGDDHEGNEHTLPPGSIGIIESIVTFPPPQGLSYAVWIAVNEAEDRGIVNCFDESDGPIDNFLIPLAGAGEVENRWTPASGYRTESGKPKWRCWNESLPVGSKELEMANGRTWLFDTREAAAVKCEELNQAIARAGEA
jgi:hypothetical protein